jgi:hypothetical protein
MACLEATRVVVNRKVVAVSELILMTRRVDDSWLRK